LWIAKKHSVNPCIKLFWIVIRDVIPAIAIILVISAIILVISAIILVISAIILVISAIIRINNATSSLILKLNPIIFGYYSINCI
jgi:hypothetical protein